MTWKDNLFWDAVWKFVRGVLIIVLLVGTTIGFFMLISPPARSATLTPDRCDFPGNLDRWAIREATEQESLEYGLGVLVFEYWNNEASCSNNIHEGIEYHSPYYGVLRFHLIVQVLTSDSLRRERIELRIVNAPYIHMMDSEMLLEDGEEPGQMILLPSMY